MVWQRNRLKLLRCDKKFDNLIIRCYNNTEVYGGVSVSTVPESESISIPQTVAALKYGKFKIKC